MNKRKLPIGIQTFREVREENCYYVDKTAYIQRLLDEGKHYFLSRPRRFGKSLFLDTLKELFEGNEPLFAGLHIHDHWDWSVCHPVLRLDFSSGTYQGPDDLQKEVAAQLNVLEDEAEVVPREDDTAPARFRRLMKVLHERNGQRVAVLVDEYDKPILDALEMPEVARANRDFLRDLYSTVKFADAHIRFTFLTGVSKFSKVSLFSGLNNLIDLTLDPPYSAICGYTEADLDRVFAPELPGLDRDEIGTWYNGYNWLGEEQVYNPFDVLLFRNREFGAYWFETGTPAFLVETLFKQRVSSLALDNMVGNSDLLSTFDVDAIAPEALLFQTGYLTIHRTERRGSRTYYRAWLPQLGGAAEPERELAEPHDRGFLAPGGAQCPTLRFAARQRLRRAQDPVPRFFRQRPLRVVYQQRHRPLRGLLHQRLLFLFRGLGLGHHRGGQQQPRAARHGGPVQ